MQPDPSLGLTATMDQLGSYLEGFAGLLGQYFRALQREGFGREEALSLVNTYHGMSMERLLYGPERSGE